MTKRKWIFFAIVEIICIIGFIATFSAYKNETLTDIQGYIFFFSPVLAVGMIFAVIRCLIDDFSDWLNKK